MTREIADRLLESLWPIGHLPTRASADIPIGGPNYRQIDCVVQEIDGLAEILIGDATHYHQKSHQAPALLDCERAAKKLAATGGLLPVHPFR